eukprot:g80765.t1
MILVAAARLKKSILQTEKWMLDCSQQSSNLLIRHDIAIHVQECLVWLSSLATLAVPACRRSSRQSCTTV